MFVPSVGCSNMRQMSAMDPPVWEKLDDEYESFWTPFDDKFGFRPGTQPGSWPAIKEPHGSITFGLAALFDGTGTGEWLRRAIDFTVIWALADIVGPDSPLIAMDWQHPCHYFWPHRNRAIEPSGMLSMNHITPVPDGDYYIFVNEDMSAGTFGHPWEQTLCVFGADLVSKLEAPLAAMLPIVRSKSTAR